MCNSERVLQRGLRRAGVAVTGLVVAGSLVLAQPVDPEQVLSGKDRGRDPWVFRCIFEDRTRMVVLALSRETWWAFNPFTCSPYKVWTGDIELRGKVWDFSQDNSVGLGEAMLLAPSAVFELADGEPVDWTLDGVAWDGQSWRFTGTGATLTSPAFDLSGFSRCFLAFDERSMLGRARIEFSADGGASWNGQWFGSTTHINSNDSWQWNFKQIDVRAKRARVRFVQTDAGHDKSLRAIRMFGDKPAWFVTASDGTEPEPADLRWQGYRLINRTDGVELNFAVSGVAVTLSPELSSDGWTERLTVRGLEPGVTLSRIIGRVSQGVTVSGDLPPGWSLVDAHEPGMSRLIITGDGTGELRFAGEDD